VDPGDPLVSGRNPAPVDAGRSWPAHVVGAATSALLAVTAAFQLTQADLLDSLPFMITLVAFLTVGWLLAARLPRHPLGWLLLAVPALFTLWLPFGLLGMALLEVAPNAAAWLLWYGGLREDGWAWLLPVGLLFTQIPLRFPDGRLPTPAWRWFSWFTIVAIVIASAVLSTASAEVAPGVANPAHIEGIIDSPWAWIAVFAGLLATSFLGSAASLFVRYRRSGEVARAQLRWVLWGTAIPVTALVFGWLVPEDWNLLNSVVGLSYALIPISIAIAVLRYRLYEIDRIISRTASYTIVTLFAVAVYAVVVTSVTWVLPDAPAVAVAVATLVAAALFLPLLRRVRRWVDRRFNRAQYDAQRVVAAFGERLRTGVDPHTASADLVRAVEQTLQPTSIGVWTRDLVG
jgi:hypothetical protein